MNLWKSKFDGLTTSVMVLGVAEGAVWTPLLAQSLCPTDELLSRITDLLYVFMSTAKCLKKLWLKNRAISFIVHKLNHILELQYTELTRDSPGSKVTDSLTGSLSQDRVS